MQQKVSLYCNEKNFISHGKLLAKAKRILIDLAHIFLFNANFESLLKIIYINN